MLELSLSMSNTSSRLIRGFDEQEKLEERISLLAPSLCEHLFVLPVLFVAHYVREDRVQQIVVLFFLLPEPCGLGLYSRH